ncbi:hypothetical protein ACH5RR_006711 [Cinchona calisaya]|uniref:Uncharacterized protein n=1 Tax=Cinchona calisaya TaxID=153742 RepID=A0ABD3APT5_9GENT
MSKMFIKRVPSSEEWSSHPSDVHYFRSFFNNSDYAFNYWDLMTAFTNVLYYNSPPDYKYTWWIRMDSSILENKTFLPMWFYRWFQSFGIPENFLPNDLQTLFKQFKMVFSDDFIDPDIPNRPLLHFFTKFNIP